MIATKNCEADDVLVVVEKLKPVDVVGDGQTSFDNQMPNTSDAGLVAFDLAIAHKRRKGRSNHEVDGGLDVLDNDGGALVVDVDVVLVVLSDMLGHRSFAGNSHRRSCRRREKNIGFRPSYVLQKT